MILYNTLSQYLLFEIGYYFIVKFILKDIFNEKNYALFFIFDYYDHSNFL